MSRRRSSGNEVSGVVRPVAPRPPTRTTRPLVPQQGRDQVDRDLHRGDAGLLQGDHGVRRVLSAVFWWAGCSGTPEMQNGIIARE